MLRAFRSLISPELSIVQSLPQAYRVVLVARPKAMESCCSCCRQTRRVHSHYRRRLTDLPWQGRVVEIRLHARRFRCANSQCPRRIFTERLSETAQPKARRTVRLGESQLAVGGEPGLRLSDRLAMPVSGDTLLRMVRAAGFEPPQTPRVVGIDDWAWRKGQRYGTIICDLERNRVLDLLPDRNADTVASWLERILASRSSRAIVPAFMSRAPVAVLPLQRRSPTAGIFSRTWAKRYVWRSAVIARRSAPPEGHGVRDGQKRRSRAGTSGRKFPKT